MADTPSSDPYAAQKANLRDTAKYMAAAYAACGTALFAGASLSGIGALPSDRPGTALVAAGIALLCVMMGIADVLNFLISDFPFATTLEQPARDFVRQNGADLLPPDSATYGDLLDRRTAALNTVNETRTFWAGLTDAATEQQQ